MAEQNDEIIVPLKEAELGESDWLNWCRLCAKDDVCGNVKVYSSENVNAWNSVLVLAIRRYFDVHMRLEDELSGVLCKECYTLISELIDFAEHVNKVQAIFEILRQEESDEQLDIETLRRQYGLREGDWTHIIKPVSEMENPVKLVLEDDTLEPDLESIVESINSCDRNKGDQLKLLVNDEITVNHLPIEEILVTDWNSTCDTQDVPIKKSRKQHKHKKVSKKYTKAKIKSETMKSKVQEIQESNLNESKEANASDETAEKNYESRASGYGFDTCLKRHQEEHLEYCTNRVVGHNASDGFSFSSSPSKRRSMECNWCGKVYHNPGSYEKHRTRGCRKIEQRPKIDRNTFCELCNKTLSSAAALRLHKEGMHENAKPYVCDFCGKQLKTITALNEHKLVHTEERPFSCDVCRAGFKNKARLKVHFQIHEEPHFICNICGKKLQTRRTWNMHKLVHSEERKFKCDVCDALFKRSKTLKTHLLSHTGMRPYVCSYCGQSFACNANCRAHKLKKHPQELKMEESESLTSRLSVPTLEELRVMSQKFPKGVSDTPKTSSI